MVHLFLGQLVSTFDEEFRILFAQSQPLSFENGPPTMEELSLSQKRQYPNERASLYRESRKFLSQDTGHPEEWARHSYDERVDVDWRMVPLKKQESLHGSPDMYSRFPSQQPRMDPSFEQVPSRIPMMENPAFKRHSYAEGGRFCYPFLQQQGMPEPENQRRQFLRGQQLYTGPGPGPEADYSGADKFCSQDYHLADQYTEPQEMQPPHNFDPVLNYLSSTRNVDFESSSDKLLPATDSPFSSSHPRRPSLGQPYPCQTSPTPSNPTDQKQFFQEPNIDRKDPRVKRGLRNWRITSYLSAYDNPEDEVLPSAPLQAPDPVEEPSYPIQLTAPAIDLSFPKIPNVREFKVHAVPRASQMPSYAKTTAREQPKKLPDESPAAVTETKTTPTPSESSSTTEGEKAEEAEPKEPKMSVLRREDSFRRKYNPAMPRSSRLRSSLIFSSLEQQHSQETKTAPGQQDEESDKNEGEQTKLPFVSQALGQRRAATREPIEWSRYIKSGNSDKVAPETSKVDDGNSKEDAADKDQLKEENSKKLSEKGDTQESLKPSDVEETNSSPSMPQFKPSKVELPKINQPVQPLKSLVNTPLFVDMSDPDKRLMFFKELAAKRKAAMAAEVEKSKDKSPVKPTIDLKDSTTIKMKEPKPKETSEKMAESKNAEKIEHKALMKPPAGLENNASENIAKPSLSKGLLDKNAAEKDAGKTVSTEAGKSINKTNSLIRNEHSTSQSCEEKETQDLTESENIGPKNSQSTTSLHVESPPFKPPEEPKLSKPAVKERTPSHSPTTTNPTNVLSLVQGTDESESLTPDSTSNDFTSLTPSPMDVPPSSASAALDSKTQSPVSVLSESIISSTPLPSEQHTSSEFTLSNPSVQSSSSDHNLPDSGSQTSPSHPPSSFTSLISPAETLCTNGTPEDSRSSLTSVMLPLNSNNTEAQESVSPSLQETSKLDEETSQKSTESETTQVHLDPVCRLISSETLSEVHVESDICHDTDAAGSGADTSSSQSTTETNSGEACAPTPSEKDALASDYSSHEMTAVEEPQVPGSSKDFKADSIPPSLSPSLPEPGLPVVSVLEGSTSTPDQNEIITPTSNQPDPPNEHSASEAFFPALSNPDMITNASQSETTASSQDALTQANPPSELNLTGSSSPTSADTVSCSSPLTKSAGSGLSPESENREIDTSAMHSPSDTNSLLKQITTDSNETPMLPSTETSSPAELTSEVPTEPNVPCKTPESVTPESHSPEPPAENSNKDNQSEVSKDTEFSDPDEKKAGDTEATTNKVNKVITRESINSEKTNDQVRQSNCSEPAEITSEEVVPLSPQSKQPKSSQSRYHSSTANVLSSSNLRDDTKLLLEQISANSQSRNDATKEPVTDDEKEDEADKNARREKGRGISIPGRGQPKSTQEREKVLERIQSMRKERKVYSRFEV